MVISYSLKPNGSNLCDIPTDYYHFVDIVKKHHAHICQHRCTHFVGWMHIVHTGHTTEYILYTYTDFGV